MTLDQLKANIQNYKIPEGWYSINEGLKWDAYILSKTNSYWEYFYNDEKGNQDDITIFQSEEDAFDFLWNKLKYQFDYFKQ